MIMGIAKLRVNTNEILDTLIAMLWGEWQALPRDKVKLALGIAWHSLYFL